MGSTGYTSNMKSLSLIVLFMSLLEPTTRHEQLRDDWNLAWLLLEKGMPMIVRVPDQGVLRLRVRSRGAVRVSVRAAGDLVTQRRLVPGTDPGAGFPGQQPSPMIELRVSVPEGGESYRIEVDRGSAWLAPSYVDATGQSTARAHQQGNWDLRKNRPSPTGLPLLAEPHYCPRSRNNYLELSPCRSQVYP